MPDNQFIVRYGHPEAEYMTGNSSNLPEIDRMILIYRRLGVHQLVTPGPVTIVCEEENVDNPCGKKCPAL